MTRLLVVGLACIALIAFVTLIATRLIRARSRGLSVRLQVFLALALVVGAFSFGVGVLVIDRVDARAERLARATAEEEARIVAALLESELGRTTTSLEDLARQLQRGRSRQRSWPQLDAQQMGLELLDPTGKVLLPEGRSTRAHEEGAVSSDAAIVVAGQTLGTVRVVKPTIVIEALLADFAPTVLVISLVLGAASALAAVWIGRTIAAPIETLSRYSQRVSQGERPKLPQNIVGREVAQLSAAIETMRERLEGRPFVEAFAADLSHELKNPVAAIRASAEVLEDGALDEPEEARRFVGRIREAARRIETLLSELLSLAEVETRGPEHLGDLRVENIVAEVATSCSSPERIEVHVERSSRLRVAPLRGDASWIHRAIGNLVENGLLHGEPNAPVTVRVMNAPEEIRIDVLSAGQLHEHVRKSLFRRFVTTRRELGGSGLGLSIVKAVAEAHGGHAELLEAGPPQVVFRLRLPRKPAAAGS